MTEPTNPYAEPTRGQGRLCDLPERSDVLAWHPLPPSREILLTEQAVYVADKFAGAGYRFTREDLAESAQLWTITGGGVIVSIPLDKKRALPFSKTSIEALEDWLGPHFSGLVENSVRARWLSNVMIGVFFVITTQFSKMDALDIGWLLLGVGMVVCGLLARLRPKAWIWWLDGTLSGVLAALIVADVLRVHGTYWRLGIAALLVFNAAGRFRLASHVHERLGRGGAPV